MSRKAAFPQTSVVKGFAQVTGSFTFVLGTVTKCSHVLIQSSLDADIDVSLDSGSTPTLSLIGASALGINFGAAGQEYSGSIYVRHRGVAPTSGSVSFSTISYL